MITAKMSNLNRFAALYSDDEDDSLKSQPKKVAAAPAPAPAPKKKAKPRGRGGRGGRGRGGRGRGRGRRDDDRRGGYGRDYDRKDDRRDQRRRDDRDRRDYRDGENRRTRQPRNGVREHRQGRDPKKGGHGGIGTKAQDVEAGIAEVRGEDATGQAADGEQVPAVEEEPEEVGLSVEEYNAKVLAEKRAALAKLTGGRKEVRKVEAVDGEQVVREREGVVKTYGTSKKKAGGNSKKKKKGFVSADRFFATKAREERSDSGRGRGRGRGRGYGDRDDRGRGRGRGRGGYDDRRNDRRNDDRSRGSKPRAININDTNAFPTLG